MKKHAHCGYCGSAFAADQPWPRLCASCHRVSYLNPTPVAVCLLPVDGGLLCVRRAIPPAVGQLALPGGYIDLAETWQGAAARELFEETGIVADGQAIRLLDWQLTNTYEIYPVWRHRYAPGVTRNTEHVFSVCVPPSTPVILSPREHTRFAWHPWLEAADCCFSPSNAEAILQLPAYAASSSAQ